MQVADTSALVSLAIADCIVIVLAEFDVHTTSTVIDELEETAAVDDVHGRAAKEMIDSLDRVTVHDRNSTTVRSSRIDAGEASCLALVEELDAEFLLTDDLRALPELQALTEARVALSPIVLRALVERGVLGPGEARDRLDRIAESRDWLGAPIYRRARRLFEEGG